MVSAVLFVIQLLVTLVVGVYFYTQLRQQRKTQPAQRRESGREFEKLQKMRTLTLSEPLAERVRPSTFEDIVGQADGIKSLKAILCGKNPQHVLIYGPPGIGKTCAARLVLEAAKESEGTPFRANAPFIEMDATCARFDERSIADAMHAKCHPMSLWMHDRRAKIMHPEEKDGLFPHPIPLWPTPCAESPAVQEWAV